MNAKGFEWIEPYLCTNVIKRIFRKLYLKSSIAMQVAKFHTKGKPNAIFFWIPKNAGTSVYSILVRYGCIKYKSADAVKYAFPNQGLVTFCHMSYTDLINEGFIDPVYDNNAIKFCFVRNPYVRAVSLYEYLKKINKIDNRISFETFCHIVKDRAFDPPNLINSTGISQCNLQVAWIKNKNDDLFVDYIGRVENFKKDCTILFKDLNIRGKIPTMNQSTHNDWRIYYNRVSKYLIKKVYEEDFERFKYSNEI